MPKILQMFKRRKRQKGRSKRAFGPPEKVKAGNIVAFPPVFAQIQEEEYPAYELISRWLKLADEMLGSADQSHLDNYDGNSRKKA